ncbi:MAG: PD-(D/E)XK nuclease family protein [Pseudomonadota bacterium]
MSPSSAETSAMRSVYNMPSGVPFLRSLAKGLHAHYGDALQDGLVLLPTRRAARALEFSFVRQAAERGVSAALLPRLRPLADINPDEPPFEPGELAGMVDPGIDPVQRRFEIAQLVARYHERASDLPLDPATALHMADPLIEILDDAALEEVRIQDQAEWKRVCDEAAIHFQHAGTLYQIIETYWPERLTELSMMDPSARRVALLDALADLWRDNPPDYPVIVAGSTGTLQATARLMRVVADMPFGMVVLPGLQKELPEQIWSSIDARHPQASLKGLMDMMEMPREAVASWPWIVDGADRATTRKRQRVLAEALVPVDATGDWLGRIKTLNEGEGADVFETALKGLSLIEARTDAEEALSIALIMREALETPGRTAALVTPDQLLAQRVRARLSRWDVDVSMSQGLPIEQTHVGVFLTSLLELACDPYGPIELSMVFNHPLTALDHPPRGLQRQWQRLEKKHFRGPRPDPEDLESAEIIQALHAAMAPLLEFDNEATPDVWASGLIAAASALARTENDPGARRLWETDAGRQSAQMLESVVDYGASLPATDAGGFSKLLSALLKGSVVRPSRGTHPRLQILGPLEARLLDVDVIILGGLNEGTWPASVNAGPFLSRQMRQQIKLSLPERRYGLAAHDFAELAANPTVFLTRSQKDDTGPTVASRWIWRLKTLLSGATGTEVTNALLGTGKHYLDWARAMDCPEELVFIDRPNPKPPVEKRWARQGRKISITNVSKWIRDPYSLFGREVLRLKPLDPLDAPLDARHFGTAMHAAVEAYIKSVEAPQETSNRDALIQSFEAALLDAKYPEEEVFKERPRLEALSDDLLTWFAARHAAGFDIVGTEVRAEATLEGLDFELNGILDLVERSSTGYAFSDFKTGSPSSASVVGAGFDPQLPLAAWLAEQGALEDLPQGSTDQLGYVRLKGSGSSFKHSHIAASEARSGKTVAELVEEAITTLRQLIEAYDQPGTGYSSQPRAQYVNDYGDYDDLARRAEWSSILGSEE